MNNDVFINCLFDEDYRDCFEAMIFALVFASFSPRCALEESYSGDIRFDKLCRMIQSSDTTIHDLSRVELGSSGLPRFNMPLELGLTLGAKRFGSGAQAQKRVLIMVGKPFDMPRYMSDLGGNDPFPHGSRPKEVVRGVRDFLYTAPDGKMLPGSTHLHDLLGAFKRRSSDIATILKLTRNEVHPLRNYRNFMQIVWAFKEQITAVPGEPAKPPSKRRRRP